MPNNKVEEGSIDLGYNRITAINVLTSRINGAEAGVHGQSKELVTHINDVLKQHRALLAQIQRMTDVEFAQGNMSAIVKQRLNQDF